jgi:hypothetical protein
MFFLLERAFRLHREEPHQKARVRAEGPVPPTRQLPRQLPRQLLLLHSDW